MKSMIDVLTLCNFCILANVLDFHKYYFDGLNKSDSFSLYDWDQQIQWDQNTLNTTGTA